MGYKALLETSEARYDVCFHRGQTGRSITHVYQRVRLAELLPETAEVFQANQITAGQGVLISRLLHERQNGALDAVFREDWRSKEKHPVSVREPAQWIRENLILALSTPSRNVRFSAK